MARILFIVALISFVQNESVQAQRFGKWLKRQRNASAQAAKTVPNKYKTPYPTQTGRMSIGVLSYPNYNHPRPGQFDPYRFDNYVYDPYRFGSFEAPDLLNDPYFRERHRYDSHFPGRRYKKASR